MLTALGERDATIAAIVQRAGAALRAMIIDESLTVSEAMQWCAGASATAKRPGFVSYNAGGGVIRPEALRSPPARKARLSWRQLASGSC